MVKQYTGNQYDDDLTVGTEDYDDSYYTGTVDFFEFATDDESPISRLKGLILSIDWEITDEILMQFNEELIDLRDIWAGEKINLVYVQALEKISKYIYQKKANSHPSAIKLLLTLYHNLEKIVSSYDLTEEQKKEILLEDVKRFESLKRHIGQQSQPTDMEMPSVQPKQQNKTDYISTAQDLLTLKANVLGIDWEITDEDLNALRQEVVRLEEKFANSRPKLILLQGIGTLAAYIKLKKSNAHADAFKLLHLFYESLEKIVATSRSLEEEKAILFPAVEKFNSFKTLLGPTIASEAICREEEVEEGESSVDSITLAPAFAELSEEDVKGFQAEEEAEALGLASSGNIDSHVESFFMEENFNNQESDNSPEDSAVVDEEKPKNALQGVDVEIDDEDEAEGLFFAAGHPTPALSEVHEEETGNDLSPALAEESPVEDEIVIEWPAEDDDNRNTELDFSILDKNLLLQGVDVETDADDDSDEEALPLMGGELAPALAANDEVSTYNAAIFEKSSSGEKVDDEIAATLGGFFDEEIALHLSPVPAGEEENDQVGALAVKSMDEVGQNEFYAEEEFNAFNADNVPAPNPTEEILAGDLLAESFERPSAEEQEDDIAVIDERLNSFFDLEEEVAKPEEEIFLHEEPEMAEDILPGEELVIPLVCDDIEEEVVFELVEEGAQLAETAHTMYQSLQSCVDALGIELKGTIIASLLQEANSLYQKLADKPLERTFLQLLLTVARHIDQNRYDSSTEATPLLQSVCTALSSLQMGNLQHNQELLLTETHKVLQWQEHLLEQLAAG